ncbi:Insulin-induced gene 2 protein [Liparis tanakae]|uniref:Insulin-induced gene protein n=1 Tax=Liparis tanakae TaxID=230148 RepID=A0A4Z2GSI6_9TELE|nr:Insulin-induced gene 2 protein [Liparis tanakae]
MSTRIHNAGRIRSDPLHTETVSPLHLCCRMSLTLTAMSNSAVTEGQEQRSGSGPTPQPSRGPYISVITNRTTNLFIRGAMLFSVGVFLALVLNLLQVQRNVTLFPPDVISSIFSSAWWVPPCCGTASAMIGLLYPRIDSCLGEPHKFKREWSSVMRCVAVFVGINHASAKVDFANNVQLSLTLAALSIGLWWTFDRSRSGFALGVSIALLATLATQLLVYNGVFHMNTNSFRKRRIRTEDLSRPLKPESVCTQHQRRLAGLRGASWACQTRPQLLIGCLVLSAEQYL